MSVRLVILGMLQWGEMHGYELKQHIERKMGDWTSIAFGSIYFALRKLSDEGLVERTEEERHGNRPSRSTRIAILLRESRVPLRTNRRFRARTRALPRRESGGCWTKLGGAPPAGAWREAGTPLAHLGHRDPGADQETDWCGEAQ